VTALGSSVTAPLGSSVTTAPSSTVVGSPSLPTLRAAHASTPPPPPLGGAQSPALRPMCPFPVHLGSPPTSAASPRLAHEPVAVQAAAPGIAPSSAASPPVPPGVHSTLSLPPFFYEADQDDPIDVALLQELVALNLEVSARLNIKRVRPSEYDIEHVRVTIYWEQDELFVNFGQAGKKKGGRRSRRKSDSAASEGGSEADVPLAAHLRQLANVDPRKLLLMDPNVDSAVAAAAFAGATGGLGPGVFPQGVASPPGMASPPAAGPPNVGLPGMGLPSVGPPGAGPPGVRSPGVGPPGVGSPAVGPPGVGSPGVGPHCARPPGMGLQGVGPPGMGLQTPRQAQDPSIAMDPVARTMIASTQGGSLGLAAYQPGVGKGMGMGVQTPGSPPLAPPLRSPRPSPSLSPAPGLTMPPPASGAPLGLPMGQYNSALLAAAAAAAAPLPSPPPFIGTCQ